MEWLVLVGLVAIGGWLYLNSKAKGIARRRAADLAERTAIPPERIYREMRQQNLTPGEWAQQRGLDPLTFESTHDSGTRRSSGANVPHAGGDTTMPTATGPDYLLTLAEQAAERDQPYAGPFTMMVQQAFGTNNHLLTEVTAKRELREHEASPVSIILGAYQAALENGDDESAREILQVGLSLLAKWSSYLVMREEHPDLDAKTSRPSGEEGAGSRKPTPEGDAQTGPDESETVMNFLLAHDGPASLHEIARETGLDGSAARRAIRKLTSDDRLKVEVDGRYSLSR